MNDKEVYGLSLQFFVVAVECLVKIHGERYCDGLEAFRKALETAEQAFCDLPKVQKQTKAWEP